LQFYFISGRPEMSRSRQRNNAYVSRVNTVGRYYVAPRVFRKSYYLCCLLRGAAHSYSKLLATAPLEGVRNVFEGQVMNANYYGTR
jgi:hypothetical protein